jgi:leishmanolysin
MPTSVAPTLATQADGTAGLPLATPPTFAVKDASGNVLGGVAVTVAVTAGGGTITGAPTTTVSGAPTPIGTWTLGKTAGVNTVTITVAGLPAVTISVNGKAGAAAAIAFVSGVGQSALAGTAPVVPAIAQVRDQFGNGVAGASVVFTIADGDGTVAGSPSITDASGNATALQWKLGKSAAPQSLRASSGGFSALLTATVTTSYAVDLRVFGPTMPAAAAAAFAAAAARISGSVVGDVPDISITTPLDLTSNTQGCGIPVTLPAGIIDDVVIYASVASIDGPGKILASSGPCFIRQSATGVSDPRTIIGVMQFDADDIETLITNGTLSQVILHEMLHVVGIGTLWDVKNLLLGRGTVDSRYVGTMGVNACVALGGSTICPTSIPVENTGGSGTADGHWRETTFGSELMTGFINAGFNPLSSMSIQSLGDLGYVVNQFAADAYNIPGTSIRALSQSSSAILGNLSPTWENVVKPNAMLSRAGRLTRLERQ